MLRCLHSLTPDMRGKEMTRHTETEQNEWKLANIELLSWLFAQPEGSHNFILDMQRTVHQWGMLTERQTEAARKWKDGSARREEQRKQDDEISKNAPALEAGRRELHGTILATKWHDGDYGSQLKMTVRLQDGNRVWGTVPSSLWDGSYDEEETLKGREVVFTATVKPREDHFGFFSRPNAARLV